MLILAAKKWEWSMSTASQLHRGGSKEYLQRENSDLNKS